MTFEEMERTMQFILNLEAKNTVTIERLSEEIVAVTKDIKEQQVLAQQHQQSLDRHEHLLDRCAKLIYGLAENQVKADARMTHLEEYLFRAVEQYDSRQARMEAQLSQLTQQVSTQHKNPGEAPNSANDQP